MRTVSFVFACTFFIVYSQIEQPHTAPFEPLVTLLLTLSPSAVTPKFTRKVHSQPMMQSKLAQSATYAKALFAEAEKADRLDEVRQSLVNVRAVAESGAGGSWKRVLEAPKCIVMPETKKKFVQDVLKEVGAEDDLVSKTFSLMVEKEAADVLPAMIDRFEGMWRDAKGIVIAKVTTAAPLEECNFDFSLDEELQKMAGADKTVWTATTVDPSIRGGVMIEMGGKLYDYSMDTKLKNFMQYILDQTMGSVKIDEEYGNKALKRLDDRMEAALSKYVPDDVELQFPNVDDEVERMLAQTEGMDRDAKANWLRQELADFKHQGKSLIPMEDSAWIGLNEKERQERFEKDFAELSASYVPPTGATEVSEELKGILEELDQKRQEEPPTGATDEEEIKGILEELWQKRQEEWQKRQEEILEEAKN